MPALSDWLPYAAAVVTMLSGALGFFWAKSGERSRIGGAGWALLALILCSGGLTLWQTFAKAKNDGDARVAAVAERDQAKAAARDAQGEIARLNSLMQVSIGDFDMDRPPASGSFYFDAGVTRPTLAPRQAPGFTGAFPTLAPGETGRFALDIPDDVSFAYDLSARAGGGVLLTPAEGTGGGEYALRTGADHPFFAHADRPDRPIESDHEPVAGEWVASGEEYEFGYFLELGSRLPMRGMIGRLSQTRLYGRLDLALRNASDARRRQIIAGYKLLAPFFVFAVPTHRAETAKDDDCATRIRMPLEMVPVVSTPARLAFEIRAAPAGFTPEICGYEP